MCAIPFLTKIPPLGNNLGLLRQRPIFRQDLSVLLQRQHHVPTGVEFRNEQTQIDTFALTKHQITTPFPIYLPVTVSYLNAEVERNGLGQELVEGQVEREVEEVGAERHLCVLQPLALADAAAVDPVVLVD